MHAMPKHHKPCNRLSENNLMCVDICKLRYITNRPCRDCVYFNTLRCETLKKRFRAQRPSEIEYYMKGDQNYDQQEE